MKYMLDTNMVSYFFRQENSVLERIEQIGIENICISAITAAELLYGAKKRNNKVLTQSVELFLSSVQICDWTEQVAHSYSTLRVETERQGKVLGSFDLMIASHALHQRAILVTNDKAFSMINNLSLENWLID